MAPVKKGAENVPEHLLKKRGTVRKHRVSSVSLESYQLDLIASKGINISALVRELVEGYLELNFPVELKKIKKAAVL